MCSVACKHSYRAETSLEKRCLYFYIHICILEELEMEAWWKFTFRKKWMLIFYCRRNSCKILCKNTVCFLKGVNSFVDNSHCMAEFYFPFLFHHSSNPRIELVAYFPCNGTSQPFLLLWEMSLRMSTSCNHKYNLHLFLREVGKCTLLYKCFGFP